MATLGGSVLSVDMDAAADIRWRRSLGKPIFSTPAVLGDSGTVIVATAGGSLVALGGASGELLWQLELDRPIFSSPCVLRCPGDAEDLIALGCHDASVKIVASSTGTVREAFATASPVFASPSAVVVGRSARSPGPSAP